MTQDFRVQIAGRSPRRLEELRAALITCSLSRRVCRMQTLDLSGAGLLFMANRATVESPATETLRSRNRQVQSRGHQFTDQETAASPP